MLDARHIAGNCLIHMPQQGQRTNSSAEHSKRSNAVPIRVSRVEWAASTADTIRLTTISALRVASAWQHNTQQRGRGSLHYLTETQLQRNEGSQLYTQHTTTTRAEATQGTKSTGIVLPRLSSSVMPYGLGHGRPLRSLATHHAQQLCPDRKFGKIVCWVASLVRRLELRARYE